jgi:hypothetical protein
MKKLLLSIAVLILLCSAIRTFNDPSKDIIGKWKIDENSVYTATESLIKTARKSDPAKGNQMEENLSQISDMVRSLVFNYAEDHSYELTTPQGNQNGKWSLAENDHLLVVTRPGRPDRRDTILLLSPVKLQLINCETKDTILFVRP